MSESSVATDHRLVEFIEALRTDAASWAAWKTMYFGLPRHVAPDVARVCLGDVAALFSHQLTAGKGLLFIPDSHGLIVVAQVPDHYVLAEAGTQAAELVRAQANSISLHEIYHLDKDVDHFIEMVCTRFGLEQGSPQPWSSPSHLLRFCRNEGDSRHAVSPTLKPAPKILLVEDDPITRWLVRNALKDACHLATASSGRKALHLYQTFVPDLVFLDIGLPDRDGTAVLENILKQDPGARVVMFTNNDNFDTMVGTMNRGACGFVAKPFCRGRLMHYINTV